MAAQWVWIYGLKPRTYLFTGDPTEVDSRWLNNTRPYAAGERDDELQALVATSYTNRFGVSVPAIYTHLWWTAYNERTRSWAPWVRFYER